MLKKIKIVFILFFFLFLAGCASQPNNIGSEQGSKKTQKMEVLQGRLSYYYTGDSYFTLVDEGKEYTVYTSPEEFQMNTYVEVQGEFIDSITFDAKKIKKLSPAEEISYFQKRFPLLEINIKKHPNIVSNLCDTPKFSLEIKNIGKETITHKELYTEEYKYALYYFINDQRSIAHASRLNYQEVFDSIQRDQLSLIGMISNQGITYFEDIQPGQTREIEFWGGGSIDKNDFGTAGSPNILRNRNPGKYSVSFAWGIKNNYYPLFLTMTDSVYVQLTSDECYLLN